MCQPQRKQKNLYKGEGRGDNKSYIHKNKNIFEKLNVNQGEAGCLQIGDATSMSNVSDSRWF